MGFKRSQKERKYLTEIDADEINLGSSTDPYSEEPEKIPETENVEIESTPIETDAFDIPISTPKESEIQTETTRVIPSEPLAEKEIEMVKDLRTNQTGAIQMKVARPRSLKEATAVAESLLSGQTIVLNLDALSDNDGRRMIDYIAGVIFAIRGKIERPADRTFLLTPNGVSVDTEEKPAGNDEQ